VTPRKRGTSAIKVAVVVALMLLAAYLGNVSNPGTAAQAQTGASHASFQSGIAGPLSSTTTTSSTKPIGYTDFLYDYPSQGAATPAYANLIALKKAYPQVPMVAIINAGNGAGPSTNPDFTSAINAMRAVGIVVIGYVYCILTYGNMPGSRNLVGSDSVMGVNDYNRGMEQAIDAWGTYYKIDGIYMDNAVPGYPAGTNGLNNAAPGWAGHTLLQYYQQSTAYAKSTYGYTFVMDSVATAFSGMVDVADTLNLENYPHTLPMPAPATLKSLTTGVGGTSADFSLIAWLQTTVPSVAYLNSIEAYVSFVSVTDTNDQPSTSFQNALLANLNQVTTPSQVTVSVSVSQPNGAGTLPYWYVSGLTPNGHFSVVEQIASIGYSQTFNGYVANANGWDYRAFTIGGGVAGNVVSLTVTDTSTGATAIITYTLK
jgi:Spherulation-specific family 4